jgi:HD-GYP domain-containing protein (c-di-GMP phosphodiesterase class II)
MAIIRAGSGSHFDPEIVNAFAALAEGLHRAYAGQDDQRLREELQAVVARYFSEGEMLLD